MSTLAKSVASPCSTKNMSPKNEADFELVVNGTNVRTEAHPIALGG